MLLPSMTYKEMYDCLAADFDKVKLKKEYLCQGWFVNSRKR